MRPGVTSLVEVEDLHVHFGSARAVDGASLHVDAGEVLALVGESGSGKTTLIRAIQGLQKPTSGKIRVEAESDGVRPKVQTIFNPTVQMVFQDPTGALNPRQTIYEVVAEGLRIKGDPGQEADRVAAALSRAGLRPPERFFPLYPHEVSGGQRQRVVIAGAMVMEPRLLLADEPVASLDASIRGEILALMRRLVDETGLAILVVTHDLGLAWNIADRVAVMYLGQDRRNRADRTDPGEPPAPIHHAPCSRWSPRPGRWSNRSSPARSLTRPGSQADVDSIPAARCFNREPSRRRSHRVVPPTTPAPPRSAALSAAACWAVSMAADVTLDQPSPGDV